MYLRLPRADRIRESAGRLREMRWPSKGWVALPGNEWPHPPGPPPRADRIRGSADRLYGLRKDAENCAGKGWEQDPIRAMRMVRDVEDAEDAMRADRGE